VLLLLDLLLAIQLQIKLAFKLSINFCSAALNYAARQTNNGGAFNGVAMFFDMSSTTRQATRSQRTFLKDIDQEWRWDL
jgi:hypothetical protein